jgi:hypothetical protein
MNKVSRTITGMFMIGGGLILMSLPFFIKDKVSFLIWFYGIPILILGFFILFNKKEDVIEKIKNAKGGKK